MGEIRGEEDDGKNVYLQGGGAKSSGVTPERRIGRFAHDETAKQFQHAKRGDATHQTHHPAVEVDGEGLSEGVARAPKSRRIDVVFSFEESYFKTGL